MTQASFIATACEFGNLALPNGQGTAPWYNLNDLAQTFLNDPGIGSPDYQVGVGHQTWLANGVPVSYDVLGRTFKVPGWYYEGGGSSLPLGTFIAKLSQAGPQSLTFDGSTAILAQFTGLGKRDFIRTFPPYLWQVEWDFVTFGPYFSDLSVTAPSATTTPGSTGGTATTVNVSYAGTVWTPPTYVVATNSGATITALTLQNTMSGATLSVALSTHTPTSLTINCSTWQVTDSSSNSYDIAGSFPMLYPTSGSANPIKVTLATSAAASGATTAVSYFNRTEL